MSVRDSGREILTEEGSASPQLKKRSLALGGAVGYFVAERVAELKKPSGNWWKPLVNDLSSSTR